MRETGGQPRPKPALTLSAPDRNANATRDSCLLLLSNWTQNDCSGHRKDNSTPVSLHIVH